MKLKFFILHARVDVYSARFPINTAHSKTHRIDPVPDNTTSIAPAIIHSCPVV